MKTRTAAIAALTLAATLALAGCASGPASHPMGGMDPGGRASSSAADVNAADVMFARMMIPHHQQAIEMADTILAKEGIREDVRTLAENIKAAQQPEIEQLQSWLDEWNAGGGAHSMDGMGHGNGMMSEDDMALLEDATGSDATRVFLEQMIVHHEGAIDMAEAEVDGGRNAGAVALAQTIIETQTAEIAEMERLLAEL